MSSVVTLFVVLVCGQAIVVVSQRFTSADPPVKVDWMKLSDSKITSCLSSKTTYNVRISSVSSYTTIFSRVLMDMSNIDSDALKLVNGTSKHIGDCAEKAEKGGFTGFSFVDGLCTMFSLKSQTCRCDVGTGHLIYVQDSFWAKPGTIVNRLVRGGGELVEYVRFPGTVIDQLDNLGGTFIPENEKSPKPSDNAFVKFVKSIGPGMLVIWCSGNQCLESKEVDTAHCSMGCNSSSNWVVLRQFTHLQKVIDQINPRRYFLSECGNTVTINFTFPEDKTIKTATVMSHEGYGCQWYPKEPKDQECVVNFISTTPFRFIVAGMSLDGNASTCEGDSIMFYNGTQADGAIKTLNTCNTNIEYKLKFPAGTFTVIFKRVAEQHKLSGFNLGFILGVDNKMT